MNLIYATMAAVISMIVATTLFIKTSGAMFFIGFSCFLSIIIIITIYSLMVMANSTHFNKSV